jgi:GNAT superfamily N-acetyltransferase
MSYQAVPEGELAAVVTYLEMPERPAQPEAPASSLTLTRLFDPQPDRYRQLFRRVGARWLWFSRLIMADAELRAIIRDPRVEVYVVRSAGEDAGLLELDFREASQCELSFVGLIPELAGQGHGRWLLTEALRLAWRDGIERVHVHTCTLDHPAALSAYRSAGFQPYRRAIERFPDPRLLGVLPPDCAPQCPVVGTPTSASPAPAS